MKTNTFAHVITLLLAATTMARAQQAVPRPPGTPPPQVVTPKAPERPLRGAIVFEEKGASKLLPAKTTSGESRTYSSFDVDRADGELPAGMMKFADAELQAVLAIYQELSGRVVITPSNLPHVRITVRNEMPLTRVEALQMLDTVLSQNGLATVLMGTKYVKVVPAAQAHTEAPPFIRLPPNRLPESGSYLMYEVKLKKASVVDLLPALQPFSKLPNSIVAVRNANLLILRDYSANVRLMLELVEKLDQ
jgi:type II secretory pathway component GspD/PulD (secretin)